MLHKLLKLLCVFSVAEIPKPAHLAETTMPRSKSLRPQLFPQDQTRKAVMWQRWPL